jgi:hypothetical protein
MFSAILALTGGRRRLDQISLARSAVSGAIGGLLLAALFAEAASLRWADVLAIAPTFAVACAVCASGSLLVARRADRRAWSAIREGAREAKLTDEETPKPP